MSAPNRLNDDESYKMISFRGVFELSTLGKVSDQLSSDIKNEFDSSQRNIQKRISRNEMELDQNSKSVQKLTISWWSTT